MKGGAVARRYAKALLDLAARDDQVAEIGDIAFELDDSPNHASERIPFIEGYANVGRWKKAVKLTQEAIKINKFMGLMLCDTWQRIANDTSYSEDKSQALKEITQLIECQPLSP